VVQKQIKLPARHELKKTLAGDNQLSSGVPILMYHRVASHGPPGLGRFRADPNLFDEQMNALQQAGFRPVVLNDYVEAVSRSEALSGKPIVLTFDDGYRDFLTAALPALRKYSFVATVFVVAARIGGVAEWDLRFGAAAPLMSWEELSAVASEGVELGCHSLFHQPMTEMKHADLMTGIGQAREILELGLGHAVHHFAYPYGAENVFVRNLVAVLGFRSAVTCRPGISQLGNDAMRLPRIEIQADCQPEELLIQLGSF
jgi:peptidoglycan/xylan/chitin deacetylase (PgdA/CDA1 family)